MTPYPLLSSDWKECFPSVSPEKQTAQRISAKPLKHGLGEELIWNDETKRELMCRNGLGENEALKYPINLIENGDVITIDGEYLGTWEIDEDRVFNFTADGETSTTLTNVFVGLLCRDIDKWHLKQT